MNNNYYCRCDDSLVIPSQWCWALEVKEPSDCCRANTNGLILEIVPLFISNRIATIEGSLGNLDINNLSGKCINELQNRLSRSNNLILFGLKEDDPIMSNNTTQTSSHTDSQISISNNICQLFCNFSAPDLFKNSKSFRIGLFMQTQTRPRRVKIICNSVESAKTLFQLFLNAKKKEVLQPMLQGMRLAWDMTKLQKEELSLLKREMESRKKEGALYSVDGPAIILETSYANSSRLSNVSSVALSSASLSISLNDLSIPVIYLNTTKMYGIWKANCFLYINHYQ